MSISKQDISSRCAIHCALVFRVFGAGQRALQTSLVVAVAVADRYGAMLPKAVLVSNVYSTA